jgi:hopanoid biosynthesis associated protein HpnK
MKQLIVNADDFGISLEVNEAIEFAHKNGVLTSASLMMGGAAVSDALVRARKNPGLQIGLHVTVVDAWPVLSSDKIQAIVEPDGRLISNLWVAGFKYGFSSRSRCAVRAEIEGQFDAFAKTGLSLDHVNTHKHLQMHPFIAKTILALAKEAGTHGVRSLQEPSGPLHDVDGSRSSISMAAFRMYSRALENLSWQKGFVRNDWLFGLSWSGALSLDRLNGLIENLPKGLSELYCHPVSANLQGADGIDQETTALTAPAVQENVLLNDVSLTTYSQILGERNLCV